MCGLQWHPFYSLFHHQNQLILLIPSLTTIAFTRKENPIVNNNNYSNNIVLRYIFIVKTICICALKVYVCVFVFYRNRAHSELLLFYDSNLFCPTNSIIITVELSRGLCINAHCSHYFFPLNFYLFRINIFKK